MYFLNLQGARSTSTHMTSLPVGITVWLSANLNLSLQLLTEEEAVSQMGGKHSNQYVQENNHTSLTMMLGSCTIFSVRLRRRILLQRLCWWALQWEQTRDWVNCTRVKAQMSKLQCWNWSDADKYCWCIRKLNCHLSPVCDICVLQHLVSEKKIK